LFENNLLRPAPGEELTTRFTPRVTCARPESRVGFGLGAGLLDAGFAALADTKIQYGSGASTSRFMLALFQQRLNEETKKLRDVYPARIHYTRY